MAGAAPSWALAIHGGAGTIDRAKLSADDERTQRAVLGEALRAGSDVLSEGGAALDAVCAAVVVLEDSPYFNAGRGSVYTHDGRIELDASLMCGETGRAGAMAGVVGLKNPILGARAVLEHDVHVLLAAEGAAAFARDAGLVFESPGYFHTDARWAQLERARTRDVLALDHDGSLGGSLTDGSLSTLEDDQDDESLGTVGAVALDRSGHLAAATSTGGMTNKRHGRIGDSPLIGAGTWARDGVVAVSCTGHGEHFIRTAAAHDVSARMAYGGVGLADAAEAVLAGVRASGGRGGLIAVDAAGNIAMPFDTPGMYRGAVAVDRPPEVGIWRG